MSSEVAKPCVRQSSFLVSLLACVAVMALAFFWSVYQCQNEQAKRTMPLDIDGWGHRVAELKDNHSIAVLFEKPSVWKGPIVPFVYGLVYYLFPNDSAILVFNSICFGLSAGLLVFLSYRAGLSWICSSMAAIIWIVYPPHSYVHGYYFAESLISLLALLTLLCYALAIAYPSRVMDLMTGVMSGVLLLARPPFVLALAGAFLYLICKSPGHRLRKSCFILVGGAIVVLPWIVRNYLEFKAFVPFTLEGGKILYQGTYLPGDDLTMNELRKDLVFVNLERHVEQTMSPLDQYRFWQTEAMKNLLSHPAEQGMLMIRKVIRFWAYLPKGSWMPAVMTGVSSTVLLILGALGFVRFRKTPLVMLATIFVLGLWLFHSLVHAELRYNFPVLNLLLLLAMLGLILLFSSISRMLFIRIQFGTGH